MIGIGFTPGLSASAKASRLLGLLLVLVALLALSYCQGRSDGRAKQRLENQKALTEAERKARDAEALSAEQRIADERRQLEVERKYEEAIASAPGGRNSPAAVALACERLRRAYPGADLPAECRR